MYCEPAAKVSERSNGRISCNLKFCLAVQKNQQPFSLSKPSLYFFFLFQNKKPQPQHQLPKTSRRSQQSPKYMGHPSMGWTLNTYHFITCGVCVWTDHFWFCYVCTWKQKLFSNCVFVQIKKKKTMLV